MEKILFWLLNIIISSNCIFLIFITLFAKWRFQDFDAFKEYPFEFITLLLFYFSYILFKILLFNIIPVKKLEYFNKILSKLVYSKKDRTKGLLIISAVDIIFAVFYLVIIFMLIHDILIGMYLFFTFNMLLAGGILPSYLVYIWKEELPSNSKGKGTKYKKIPLKYRIKNLIK